ncbi:O-methyltransferase [Hyphococcus sp.]|jgi:predicted O-methyltransferase YrrM|uniref:O-methyltransferase n=1 Tax=Hyphococcus sp. TaxID=2038636 RepID=UPI003D12BED4
MDNKVTAVLAEYHERMQRERKEREGKSSSDFLDRHMLSVGPDTGQLINLIARSMKAPHILEIGTSFGYSGIWLAEAARASGGRVTTLEIDAAKTEQAKAMAEKAGLADLIDFQTGDAVDLIEQLSAKADFVLLDLWKDMYVACLEAFFPKLNKGAIIVADNIIFPGGESVERYVCAVRAKPGISSVLLPVGTGLEVSRLSL